MNINHDYVPEVLEKRKQYAESKAVLKQNKIRFQTPFPAKLRAYDGETVLYGSAEEATRDMVNRGFKVTIINANPMTLLEQVQRLTWRTVKKTRRRADAPKVPTYQDKLKAFRRQDKDAS